MAVLSRRTSFEFKHLFEILHENLRARNAASGGEEMLRLRAYEKLQNLVARGMVKKTGKKYKGLPSALAKALIPPLPISPRPQLPGRGRVNNFHNRGDSGPKMIREYIPILLQVAGRDRLCRRRADHQRAAWEKAACGPARKTPPTSAA